MNDQVITQGKRRCEIESGVEVPEARGAVRSFFGRVLLAMQSGDSVVVNEAERNSITTQAAFREIPVTTRSIGNKQVRVWKK
jgi:hypothetical protein